MQCCGTVQVQATFAGGLQEHLQAAGGANAATAASLRESLGTSAQILSDLKSQKSETVCCFMPLSSSNDFSGFSDFSGFARLFSECSHSILRVWCLSAYWADNGTYDKGILLILQPNASAMQALCPASYWLVANRLVLDAVNVVLIVSRFMLFLPVDHSTCDQLQCTVAQHGQT